MTIVLDVVKGLLGMFLADARLTAATLILVAIVSGLIARLGVDPILGGGLLLVGSLAIVVATAHREAGLRRNAARSNDQAA
jgi:hypothetical protein